MLRVLKVEIGSHRQDALTTLEVGQTYASEYTGDGISPLPNCFVVGSFSQSESSGKPYWLMRFSGMGITGTALLSELSELVTDSKLSLKLAGQ